jgi:hypothetical protein
MEELRMEYAEIVKKVESAKREVAKSEGAMERIMADLKTNHGCESIESADKLLVEIEEDIQAVAVRKDKALADLNALTNWDEV